MEKKKKTKIILWVIIALVILAGIVMRFTMGFAYDFQYQEHTRIDFYLGQQFSMADVRAITNEVFGDRDVVLRKVEMFEDMVAISVPSASEEEITTLMNKINEKYGLDYTYEEINIVQEPRMDNWDMIRPYIFSMGIATVLILVYIAIRYAKLGVLKVLGKTLGCLVLAEVLLLSILCITRLPINRFTIPAVFLVYVVVLLYLVLQYEKTRKQVKLEENKKK